MNDSHILLIASANPGKLQELKHLFEGSAVRCVSPDDPTFPQSMKPSVVEDGQTYYENALKKALAYYRAYGVPVLADDSGLEVDALGGGPGIYSARFGGEKMPWPLKWAALIKQLEVFDKQAWTACFRCVLCYYDGKQVPIFFEAVTCGTIYRQPLGGYGFGFDPIFYSTELNKTFGEATPEEKAKVSHRSRALNGFVNWYVKHCLPPVVAEEKKAKTHTKKAVPKRPVSKPARKIVRKRPKKSRPTRNRK